MRPQSPKPTLDRAIADRAGRQEGVLRRSDLLALGLGPQAIPYRARSGRLIVVHPGVCTLGPGPFPRRTAWLAAVWWCLREPGDTALSHVSAGAFHGHGPEPAPSVVHVTTTRDLVAPPGIVLHRTRHLDRLDWSRHGLLPVTNRSRTLVDEASMLPFPEFRHRADQPRELPLEALAATIARAPNRPGSAAAGRLLRGEQRHTKSELERRHVTLAGRFGLPQGERNVSVAGCRVDVLHRAQRLCLELDGRAHHERRAQMDADRARDAAYQLAKHRILRLTWWSFEPEEAPRTAATIRAFLDLG